MQYNKMQKPIIVMHDIRESKVIQNVGPDGIITTKFSRTNRSSDKGNVNIRGISRNGKSYVRQTVANKEGKMYIQNYVLPEQKILNLLIDGDSRKLMEHLDNIDVSEPTQAPTREPTPAPIQIPMLRLISAYNRPKLIILEEPKKIKKTIAKKTATKKTATKKTATKKTATKKSATKKSATEKSATKKTITKKSATKKKCGKKGCK